MNIARTWSNFRFYPTPITCPSTGIVFKSPEHLYQAKKTLQIGLQRKIAESATSNQAKAAGKSVTLRPHWEDEIKEDVMFYAVIKRAETDPDFLKALLSASDEDLIEWNHWHDNEWGTCICHKCKASQKALRNLQQKTLIRVRNLFAFEADAAPPEPIQKELLVTGEYLG